MTRHPDLLMHGATITPGDLTVARVNILLVSVTFALALLVPGVKMGVMAVMLLSTPAQVL